MVLTCVAVGDIYTATEGGAEQNTYDAFTSFFGDSVVVVDDAEQNEGMDNHLLDRPVSDIARCDHIHG